MTGVRLHIETGSNHDLAFLDDLPNVQSLTIVGSDPSQESDDDLERIRPPVAVDLSDDAFVHIGRLSKLKWLQVDGLPTTELGIGRLRHLRQLKNACFCVTQERIGSLAALHDLARLDELTLNLAPHASADDAMQYVRRLLDLRSLEIRSGQLGDAGLESVANLTNLEVLWIPGSQVTDAGLRHLAALKNLKSVCLSHSKIEGPGLAHLASLDRLDYLVLTDTYVDCRSLEYLEGSSPTGPILLTVSVSGAYFPEEHIKRLEQQIPKLKVDPVSSEYEALSDVREMVVRD